MQAGDRGVVRQLLDCFSSRKSEFLGGVDEEICREDWKLDPNINKRRKQKKNKNKMGMSLRLFR